MKSIPKTIFKFLLLITYLIVLLYLTIVSREPGPERVSWLTLFGSYRRAWEERHEFILLGLIDNIYMTIPLGVLLPWMGRRCRLFLTTAASFALSLSIETVQYMTGRGYFDVDDIWNNLWGALIGYGLFCCGKEATGAWRERRKVNWWIIAAGLMPLAVFLAFFAVFWYEVFGNG